MYVRPIEAYRPSVLVIDSSASIRTGIENALSIRGLRIFSASGPRNVRPVIQAKPIDLILAGLVASDHNRHALIATLRGIAGRSPRAVPVIAMSERDMWEDLEIFSAADAIGATAVLRKPFSATALLQLLDKLLQSPVACTEGYLAPPATASLEDDVMDDGADPWGGMH
jgi:CheY-like chemotaxis protein